MDDYKEDFLQDDEGKRKLAVKRLTRKIGTDVRQMTVNAPDWYGAMAGENN
jgi:glycerol-3-phosphate O-acyltransferase/dihydroxyacetone phosphate acyltransferase